MRLVLYWRPESLIEDSLRLLCRFLNVRAPMRFRQSAVFDGWISILLREESGAVESGDWWLGLKAQLAIDFFRGTNASAPSGSWAPLGMVILEYKQGDRR
jgi:hypothetical protein